MFVATRFYFYVPVVAIKDGTNKMHSKYFNVHL